MYALKCHKFMQDAYFSMKIYNEFLILRYFFIFSPSESIAYDSFGDPVCVLLDDVTPCPSDGIFSTPSGPICLEIGAPGCESVSYYDGKIEIF